MIKIDVKSKYEKDEPDEVYVAPEVWTTTVRVHDPVVEEWNGIRSYTSYAVSVETTYPQFQGTHFMVRRRYNDFVWLKAQLQRHIDRQNRKRPIERLPDLPGDTVGSFFGWGRFDEAFIEKRRRGLQEFMNKVANHPHCATQVAFIRFCRDDDMQPLIEFFQM
mmetsp:Transcript_9965/g.40351  ORF Transcript_9965/g.40351 Transcript_9965/m.40351 type:complete len:163 (+) Transcript_9965:327-815(+)|eukprot:CAMPEP_0114614240 /NCGR_PEP_ID=MMETSP0168-20121206/5546_1 /TAXON_ID=95228 ORGANISM="Vannella sp., Strain DIVA3 517/6/12" /NCGR_SAMPLE_ID=MMETSP0168 /ASSEMBLY_ACC=CAM_ASM_000044 /LENGTH=162 /DNA_ID=CAMNT_0001825271 /DNA_START=200 /DNA_END=688 /DNA_ORIENTATION=+